MGKLMICGWVFVWECPVFYLLVVVAVWKIQRGLGPIFVGRAARCLVYAGGFVRVRFLERDGVKLPSYRDDNVDFVEVLFAKLGAASSRRTAEKLGVLWSLSTADLLWS
ncbi:hypothetical protein Droror1_Dr00014746 [Drosera rotundifolia]